ncbi:MAG: histidinol-phosphate transaminase [Rhodospirillaceae bacterium]
MTPPVLRPGILKIAPYVGGDAEAPGAGRLIRLASNEGAFGPSPRALAAYQAAAPEIHRYPDSGSRALIEALARRHGLDPRQIVCGNGSDEILHLLALAYAGPRDEVIYSAHGFLVYPIAARSVGALPVAVPEHDLVADVDGLLDAVTAETRILYLANPNNPTGSYLSQSELCRLHAGLPEHVLMVIDAAYAEFVSAGDYITGQELVAQASNVVVTRTFSKVYALGGLRLGWAVCPLAIADALNRIRGPFNINRAAQAAGIAALEDSEFTGAAVLHNHQARQWFAEQLRALGLTVYPSEANFVLVSFAGWGDPATVRAFLKARGILVRQMTAYGLPQCLRITIGRSDELREVVDALSACPRGRG